MPGENWPVSPEPPALDPDSVHVWWVDVGPPATVREWGVLSRPEHLRADRFRFDRDRTRFVRSHAALREILSRYLETPAKEIRFAEGTQGKPSIDPPGPLSFNLSHAGEMALVAVARDRAVGVDVERVRENVDVEGMAGGVCTPGEREELFRYRGRERLRAFFHGWARKEALVKAFGVGVSFPLARIEVSVDPRDPDPLRWVQDPPADGIWRIRPLEVGEGYAGAVAASGSRWSVRSFRYGDDTPR